MQCKDVEAVLENEGFSPLPEAARAHVASCSACRNLVEDFSAIVSLAEELPAEVEPPTRVWVALRNQLEAEGIIKTVADSATAPQTSWLENLSRILRGRALVTAVGLLIVGVVVLQIERGPKPRIADSGKPAVESAEVPSSPFTPNEPLSSTGETLRQEEQNIPVVQQAGLSPDRADDRVDAALRQNLKALNQFIEDCRRRLREDPNDELAREYLSVAYQQKAELLSAMLDRGRSVN